MALLRSMHAKSESFLMEEVRTARGDVGRLFFFVGLTGHPKILIDLTDLKPGWDFSKGFVLKAEHGRSLTELPLWRPLSGVGGELYLIDDPGMLERRLWTCGSARCPAELHLYGVPQASAKTGLARPQRSMSLTCRLAMSWSKGIVFYAVVMDRPFQPVQELPAQAFKPEAFAVTKFDTAHLDRKIEAIFGAGALSEVTYSSIGIRVAFGSMYGFPIGDRSIRSSTAGRDMRLSAQTGSSST